MVNHEDLLHRARVAYELGRWKMGARVLAIVIPVAIVCGALSQRLAVTVGLTALLGTTMVVLRWRNRQGVRIAHAGFTAGLLPLSTGILMSQLGMMSSPVLCMSICVGSGVLAGSWAAYALRGNRGGVADSLVVGTVALATALFGCIDLPAIFLAGLTVATLASVLIARLVQSLYVRSAA